MTAVEPLQLASPTELADWLGGVPVDQRLIDSLAAAREWITSRVDVGRLAADPDDLPASLHRAAVMTAAQLHLRSRSIYGVEAFSLGADDGSVGAVLVTDPTVERLLRPWLRPSAGAAARLP